jgi:hypothetical protein
VTRDLLALVAANACLVAAGHGVLRATGLRPALTDLPWSLGVAYLAGAAAVGVAGSALLVAGLSLVWWQLALLCAALFAAGFARRGELRRPQRVSTQGLMRGFPVATGVALAILAVDLAVQPIWTDDAWSIWAIKAASIVELGGLDPEFLSSAAVFNADYPLVVPVLELVAMRFAGWPTELVPLQLGLVFLTFPAALVALLRDRVRPLLLWTVVIAVALAPSLQVQTASTVADMTLAVFFALAGAAGWRWVETGEREFLWLAGVFGAAAAGTKAEGLVFVALLFAALAVASRRRAAMLVGVGAVLTLLPWELWSRRHEIGNAIADAGGADLGPLGRLPSAGFDVTKELADPSSWLALVALGCAAVVLAFVRRERRAAAFTAGVALGCLAAVLAAYWATPLDFDYHVATSVRRVITAPALFVAAMTPLLLSRAAIDRERPLGHPRD